MFVFDTTNCPATTCSTPPAPPIASPRGAARSGSSAAEPRAGCGVPGDLLNNRTGRRKVAGRLPVSHPPRGAGGRFFCPDTLLTPRKNLAVNLPHQGSRDMGDRTWSSPRSLVSLHFSLLTATTAKMASNSFRLRKIPLFWFTTGLLSYEVLLHKLHQRFSGCKQLFPII